MSPHNLRLSLSPRAKGDFGAILALSEQIWGKAQRDIYRTKLDDALRRLAEFPEAGRSREELGPGLRSVPVEQHVIYYRVRGSWLRVEPILHQRMNASSHL
jgi:toxin ParE1/3/4